MEERLAEEKEEAWIAETVQISVLSSSDYISWTMRPTTPFISPSLCSLPTDFLMSSNYALEGQVVLVTCLGKMGIPR